VYNAIAIEDYGTPVVVLANRGFVNDARSAASSKGIPGVRVLPENIACEATVAADIESGIDEILDDIVAALTQPLSVEEKAPGREQAEQPPRLIYEGDFEEVNRFFYRRGWGDGLPITPPTEEAVAEMMTGTDLPADHIVGKIIPRMGKATVEKIAINAVMAGALPTHLPVIIAAVQALMDPGARFDTFQVSTGSWAPFLILNGPVREDIHLNTGSGALSPGNIANAAIGRAVGLISKNIGGARGGIEDMGVIGNPAKYSLVLGEYEEVSDWPPLHVERGFNREDSTLTVFFPNSYTQTIPAETSAQGIAERLASMVTGGLSCLVVIPDHARILFSEGWTKQRLKEFIIENGPADSQGPVLRDEDFIIVVAGGPGVWMGLFRSAGGSSLGNFNNAFVTTKIELPRNWDKLVAKYRDLVPEYVRY
jgi:hypothetical protein